jgi:diguanylate cyclase (GGDEF)-like protein
MFGLLDLYTLFFIGAVNAFICALMLFVLRRLHAPSRAGLMWGGITNLLLGSAMALIASRGHLPEAVSVMLANTIATVAALSVYRSFRLFCLRPPRDVLFWSIAAGLVAAQLALGASLENHAHALRIVIACASQAVCELMAVPLLLRRRGVDARLPVNWAIGAMCALAFVNIARLVALAANGFQVDGGGALAGSPLQAAAVSLYTLGPLAFALSFVGIVATRIASDLRRMAITDSLTGLLTRRGFHDRATRMLRRVDGEVGAIALMMLDLDWFKSINDRFGHNAGDRVLRRLARQLEEVLPSRAIIGRHGGEEFCVMIECGDAEEARRVAERICERVAAEPVADGEHRIPMSVSIGVATDPFDGASLAELLAVADRRLYVAKDAGRGRVVADDDIATLARGESGRRDFVPV